MVQFLELVCFPHDRDSLPLLPTETLRQALYEEGVKKEVLDSCAVRYRWDFKHILPELLNGTFFFQIRRLSTRSALGRSSIEGEGIQDEDSIEGHRVLLTLAELLNKRLPKVRDFPEAGRKELVSRMSADGFTLLKGRFIPTDSTTVHLPEETSVLKEKLRLASFPSETVMLHHWDKAENLIVHPELADTSIGQWRSFFERLVEDVATITSRNRNDLGNPPGGMGNIFEWLTQSGFFLPDEEQAARAVYGFLCSGSHPGIPPEHAAQIAQLLVLGFSQVLVFKYLDWEQNGFRNYSTP